MRQPMFPKSKEVDEKRIAFIERVVARLARRSKAKTTGLITPFPISNAVFGEDVRGPILQYLFPCAGTITKGMIDIGKKLKTGAAVNISIKDDYHANARSYVISRKALLFDPNVQVDAGDKLAITLTHDDQEATITEAWVSFLWVPMVKELEAKSYLLDEIENDLLEEKY